jgi:predicted amidohydrolase
MRIKRRALAMWALGLATLAAPPANSAEGPPALKIGVAQLALEPTLAENRDKIARFIGQAKDRGCRVVVFPETALYWPPGTSNAEIDAAIADLTKAVDARDIYALIGGLYQRDGNEKPFERLLVVDPDGKIIQTYNKMWYDARFQNCPGLFHIDGVPCAAAICADRWIRSVEELPAMAGAKILFEISNNYENEWIEELGWYWYVPRAMRNEVFVVFANSAKEDRAELTPGHGHSAVIGPDGRLLAAAGEEADRLLVTELDLARATAGQAMARRDHLLFKPFWETGTAILSGRQVEAPPHQPLASPPVELKIAAAQMACSSRLADNVAHMQELIRQAGDAQADVVVFPELAVTGARQSEIAAAKQPELEAALATLQKAAQQAGICIVFGMPWHLGQQRQNVAFVIGPDGKLLTRYAQLVVDRPELFAAGASTRSMWCRIKGAPCVVTIGRDALWSEIAEMAALRGAQVHLHLAYDRDTTPEADLRRKQLWVNLASFRTFTATVNAASPAGLPRPSAPASGGSVIWDDYHRGKDRRAGYYPYCADPLARAEQAETILYATQTIGQVNPQFEILTGKTNRQMTPWYATGARVIHTDGK